MEVKDDTNFELHSQKVSVFHKKVTERFLVLLIETYQVNFSGK